jgi:hypothetical protein
MVDSIEFRSTDWESIMDLSETIIESDERMISLPDDLYSEMVTFAENQEDSSDMITIIEGNKHEDIYVVDFTQDPHNHGVFIIFERTFRHVYLTTGIAANQYLIELFYKGAVNVKTAGRLYTSASAVSSYIDADIQYPDIGKVRTRCERDLE